MASSKDARVSNGPSGSWDGRWRTRGRTSCGSRGIGDQVTGVDSEQHGVITRPIPGRDVRVTVGDAMATQRFLDAFLSSVAELDLAAEWLLPVGDDARFVLEVLDELERVDVDDATRARARAVVADLGTRELNGTSRDMAMRATSPTSRR